MDQETLLAQLKSQVETLSGENEVKASLETVNEILVSLYENSEAKEQDLILGRIKTCLKKRTFEIKDSRDFDLDDEAKVVIQLVPLEAFRYENTPFRIDLKEAIKNKAHLAPMNTNMWTPIENDKGILSYQNHTGYSQLYKNGIVEIVDQASFRGGNQIYEQAISINALEALKRAKELLKVTDLDGKFILNISLTEVKGYELLGTDSMGYTLRSKKLSSDDLILENVLLESIESLEESFNLLMTDFWAAFGITGVERRVNM